ncbi:MAG: DUF2334 domain-containing protein [Pseudomonadota bacterium]
MRGEAPLAVCVVLHDVSPITWPACEAILAAMEDVARVPVTLLVVPDHHRRAPIEHDAVFRQAIERRMARGDEVALHGMHHLDEAPAPRGLRERFVRRVYTAGEGEFLALDREAAACRLREGIARLGTLGWRVQGFVAPAWLLGKDARAALSGMPFGYTTSRRSLILLPGGERIISPSLVFSVRSPLRRRVSQLWNAYLLRRALARPERHPLLRLGMHPADAAYPDVLRFWRDALRQALARGRAPMTKADWIGRARGLDRAGGERLIG